MAKKNRQVDELDPEEQETQEEVEQGPVEEVQPEVKVPEVVETRMQSLKRRIKETAANLAASAQASNNAREAYMTLQSDYDAKFEALQEERNKVSEAHQGYMDASDTHARIQGDLAKLEAELASSN